MDFLDFCAHDRKEEYLTGNYRETIESAPIYFEYGIENERSTAYYNLTAGLNTTEETLIIRSTWDMGFKPNGYISTQDGRLWQIHDYITRVAKRAKNVHRLLRANPASEYVISLIIVANPMGIQ